MYISFFKRLIDLLACAVGFLFFLLILLCVFIAVKLDDGGPVFFASERIGRHCKLFKMWKFRSMKVDAPDIRNSDGSTYNSANDDRMTRVGRFLRKTSIDEAAQYLNVLAGNMTLIGPRASLGDVLDTYKEDEMDKMKVKPGITGYSQAYYRNIISVREKRLKDAWYANHVSFILDVKIFFKTIATVFSKKNLYTNSSEENKVNAGVPTAGGIRRV